MEHERRVWLVPGTGSVRAKLLGGAAGLIAGLLLGGIISPSRFLTAPLTALAAGTAAVVAEYWLSTSRHTTLLPLWGAVIGATAGLVAGAVVGLVAGLLYGVFLAVTTGYALAPLSGLYLAFETSAITGVASLFTGFSLGLSLARDE